MVAVDLRTLRQPCHLLIHSARCCSLPRAAATGACSGGPPYNVQHQHWGALGIANRFALLLCCGKERGRLMFGPCVAGQLDGSQPAVILLPCCHTAQSCMQASQPQPQPLLCSTSCCWPAPCSPTHQSHYPRVMQAPAPAPVAMPPINIVNAPNFSMTGPTTTIHGGNNDAHVAPTISSAQMRAGCGKAARLGQPLSDLAADQPMHLHQCPRSCCR